RTAPTRWRASAAKFRADKVKLVAEARHLVGAVLVAGNDFVDGVDDDGDVIPLGGAADEARGEFVHGHGLAAQVPDVEVAQIRRFHAQRRVDVVDAVQTTGPVQFQIDVE